MHKKLSVQVRIMAKLLPDGPLLGSNVDFTFGGSLLLGVVTFKTLQYVFSTLLIMKEKE